MKSEYEPVHRRRKHKKNSGSAALKIAAGVIAAALFAAYIGTSIYFAGHFAFNTSVNGEDAYKKTAADFEKQVQKESDEYVLTINGRNNVTDRISSADIALQPVVGDQFKDLLKKQSALLWPIYLIKKTELTTDNTVVSYSKENLDKIIDKLAFFNEENIEEPVDAHVSEESGENGFEVVAETLGSSPIRNQIYSEIEAAVDVLANELTLSDECYTKASVTSDDETLNTLVNNLNVYCSADITYNFGDDLVKVDGTQIKEWCDIDGTNVSLNESSVRDFVDSLAKKYDTFGKTRELKSHSGETVEVSGGDYGWWMNRGEETTGLIADIKNGVKGERTPVYYQTAVQYGDNDWGDTYVEINLTDQHLWVYESGVVTQESDFVSGCVNKRNNTPVGTYSITYKERDATLNGENYSSAVSYWMPFNGNVGMHDASWRKEFGGDLYVTSGSHGCINLPVKKAEAIYEIVTKGEPVLVYGGKTLPEPEEEDEPDPEETQLTPEQQAAAAALLIQQGLLNPDGSIPDSAQTQTDQSAAEQQTQENTQAEQEYAPEEGE